MIKCRIWINALTLPVSILPSSFTYTHTVCKDLSPVLSFESLPAFIPTHCTWRLYSCPVMSAIAMPTHRVLALSSESVYCMWLLLLLCLAQKRACLVHLSCQRHEYQQLKVWQHALSTVRRCTALHDTSQHATTQHRRSARSLLEDAWSVLPQTVELAMRGCARSTSPSPPRPPVRPNHRSGHIQV